MRSFERLLRADPGFRSDGVFTVRVRTPPELFPKISDAIAFQDRVQNAPFPARRGTRANAERDKVLTDMITVHANYVGVIGMRLLAGRTFTESRQNGVTEAMIDSATEHNGHSMHSHQPSTNWSSSADRVSIRDFFAFCEEVPGINDPER